VEGDAGFGSERQVKSRNDASLNAPAPQFLADILPSPTHNAYTTTCRSEAPNVIIAEIFATASVRPEESAPLLSRVTYNSERTYENILGLHHIEQSCSGCMWDSPASCPIAYSSTKTNSVPTASPRYEFDMLVVPNHEVIFDAG
jgi:hypothetical protein